MTPIDFLIFIIHVVRIVRREWERIESGRWCCGPLAQLASGLVDNRMQKSRTIFNPIAKNIPPRVSITYEMVEITYLTLETSLCSTEKGDVLYRYPKHVVTR